MKIEIFEEAQLSSEPTELDILTNYLLRTLEQNGAQIIRYDKNVEPEAFECVKGYALPAIMVDGELICAGAYDFTQIDKNAFRSRSESGISCENCAKDCSSCSKACTKRRG